MAKMRYLDAVETTLRDEMRRDERVFLMGEDVRSNIMGGLGGLLEEFGPEHVYATHLSLRQVLSAPPPARRWSECGPWSRSVRPGSMWLSTNSCPSLPSPLISTVARRRFR